MSSKEAYPAKELNLNRYLYIMSEEAKYVAGEPHVHKYFEKTRLKSIDVFIEKGKELEVVPIIEAAALNPTLPRKDAVIFALAVCARSGNAKLQMTAYSSLKQICVTSNELFLFVKFYVSLSEHKGFGMGFRKSVNKWYLSLDAMNLADIVTTVRGSSGWTHKDLLKMTRPKTEDKVKEAILMYVIRGLKETEQKFNDIIEAREVLNHFRLIENFKHCEDAEKLAQMIESHNLKLEHVPGHFRKSHEVWNALIPRLSYKVFLKYLPRLHTYGILKYNTPTYTNVMAYLNSPERVKGSGIHPIEILIALKEYENGGKCYDYKKMEYYKERAAKNTIQVGAGEAVTVKPPYTPHAAITTSLNKVLYQSFQNPVKTDVRYMVTIDTRPHMNDKCFKCGHVTAYEAAVITLLYLLKTQKDVVCGVFTDKGVFIVNLDKNISFKDAETRLRNVPSGHTLFQKPIDWAEKKKKEIDVFINIVHSPKVYFQIPKEMRTPPLNMRSCLGQYRKKVNKKAKLISMCLCCHTFALTTGAPGIIDICGFDGNVPKIIESIANDALN